MKENKATGDKSTFLVSLLGVFAAVWPYLVWSKKCHILKTRSSKIVYITWKTKFVDLETEPLFSQNIFKTPLLPTVRAREMKFWEKVHLLPPVTCHVTFFLLSVLQRCAASPWRVCYKQGLLRLIFTSSLDPHKALLLLSRAVCGLEAVPNRDITKLCVKICI